MDHMAHNHIHDDTCPHKLPAKNYGMLSKPCSYEHTNLKQKAETCKATYKYQVYKLIQRMIIIEEQQVESTHLTGGGTSTPSELTYLG